MIHQPDDQIEKFLAEYDSVRQRYESLGIELENILSKLLAANGLKTHAISHRSKSRASLQDKLRGKRYGKLTDVTDLCGVRCICYFQEDVSKVVDILYDRFSIDPLNTVDKRISSLPEAFGYRSYHLVLSLDEATLSLPENELLRGLKAEVQVRSILDHAWAEIQHDSLGYKAVTGVPIKAQRLLAKAAALLEVADSIFSDAKRTAVEEATSLPRIRHEGVSELLPTFQLDVESALIRKSLADGCNSLFLLLNTNITNRCLPDNILDGVGVRCNARMDSSPLRPRLAGANALFLHGVLDDPLLLSRRHVSFNVSGLRCNANQLGVSGTSSPTTVLCTLAAGHSNRPGERYSIATKNVARINPGLVFTANRAVCNPSMAVNKLCPLINVRFSSRFQGAFRNRLAEKGDVDGAPPHGTRLCLRVTGLASEAKYFVDPVTRGRIAKLVSGADANGSGGSCTKKLAPSDGPSHPVPISAGQHYSGGSAALFFEITDNSDSDYAELTLYTELGSPPPSELRLTGSYAPTSAVFTASSIAPIPRFVDNPQSATFRFDGPTGPHWMAWGDDGPVGPTSRSKSTS